jgi:hypothetical protein
MSAEVLWEFVPDRRNYPPVLRSLIRQPTQRVSLDNDALVFEGMRVHVTYPNRDAKGRHVFRELKPKERSTPIALAEIVQLTAYPFKSYSNGAAMRLPSVAVDIHRVGDARTVAVIDRILGTEPHDERALADALRTVAGERWTDEPGSFGWKLDADRLAEWG